MAYRWSRRAFLKLAAAGALAGCVPEVAAPTELAPQSGAVQTEAPTAAPTATPTATEPVASPTRAATVPPASPTPVVLPTETVAPLPSRGGVVRVRHPGVWQGDALDPVALREMVDAAVARLMGRSEPAAAWAALFAPGERVAIKVNAISGSSYWTHAALALAVADRLQAAGVVPEQIVIYDRSTRELEDAGFPVNRDGQGVRCYGTDGDYRRPHTLLGTEIGLSAILEACDALINLPLLKAHGISGMSFALKNHYGTLDQPGRFHAPRIVEALGELNALPSIAERTRLVIGDALSICTSGWHRAVEGDSLVVSRDPLAHEVVGLEMLASAIGEAGGDASFARAQTGAWLAHAAGVGLGVADPAAIELLDIGLGA